MRNIVKSLLLLTATVVICAVAYPLAVWAIGQTFFASTANGSMVTGPDGKQVGLLLIAQPFTKDEYFWPRPSAASYDASASTSSALAASNYALRDRVARMLGPIVKYKSGPQAGQLVAPDVEAWFQKDQYQGQPHLVAQWADNHNELAQGWVSAILHTRNTSLTGPRTIRARSTIGLSRIPGRLSRNHRTSPSCSSRISPKTIQASSHRR